MPTYAYQCPDCHANASVFQTIHEYCDPKTKKVPYCDCDDCPKPMERRLEVVPSMSGLANALAGDRHYDGMRAPDGTDISTRSKHRAYMKANNLTTMDDYSHTWKKAAQERAALRNGTFQDKELRQDLTQKVMTAVSQPD
jgi:hypothetical protein